MKKKLIIAAMLAGIAATNAQASEPPADEPKAIEATKVALPRLLSLIKPDLEDGDLVSISRPFGNWVLRCEWLLSANKRVCSVEQQTVDGNAGLVWKIAPSEDNKPLLLISAPTNLDLKQGMRLSFSGLEKTLPEKNWFCTNSMCLTSFNYEGFLQAAITNSPEVKFSFALKTADGASEPVELSGPMDGLSRALNAAAVDPFGREALAKATAEKPVQKTSEAKPVPAPRQHAREKSKPVAKSQQEAKNAPAKKPTGLF
ncbi:hypothetical protein FG152_24565 [Ochrobactrum sp. XJ1]|nr:hypothetical protein [Ochrobactrum sp. XJ1]